MESKYYQPAGYLFHARLIIHNAYSEVALDAPYLEEYPNGPRYRNTQRDEGMKYLKGAWLALFGTVIPKPIDS